MNNLTTYKLMLTTRSGFTRTDTFRGTRPPPMWKVPVPAKHNGDLSEPSPFHYPKFMVFYLEHISGNTAFYKEESSDE